MRALRFILFAVFAMASEEKVHVVDHNPEDNPNQVHVVDHNPEDNPNQVHVVDHNPEYDPNQVNVVDHNPEYNPNQVHVVDHNPEYNPDQIVIQNPDPFFSQPSHGPGAEGYEPISIGPAFVDFQYRPYKQYDHPGARDGK